MSALSVALAHYRRRAQRARALERQAADLWRQVDRADIAGSWASLMPQLFVTLSAMQRAEAAEADAYVALAMAEQGEAAEAAQRVVPEAWSGWASDGRALDSLLMQPVVTAKTAIKAGRTIEQSMAYAQAALQMIVGTQVADAGRTADQAAMATHGSQGYIRMVVGDTCSRCVVLAGRWYRWNAGFDRHPSCDCVGIPAAEDRADDLRTDPRRYFHSLSRAEQDGVFGKANAQAIRDGADIGQVVNAKRKGGLYSAGGKRYTRSSTHAKRGQTRGRARLTVEQIYKDARSSRERAIELLRQHRYIVDVPRPAQAFARLTAAEAAAMQKQMLHAAAWTAAQREAVVEYTAGWAREINGMLRGTMPPGGFGQELSASLYAAMRPLGRDATLYRYTAADAFGVADVAGLRGLVGSTFQDRGFLSTTIAPSGWPDGQMALAARRQVRVVIEAPAGTPAAYVDALSKHPGQWEVILGAGIKFRITGVTTDGAYTVVRMRVIA